MTTRVRGKGYSRLGLPLLLTSSTLRGQLPFAAYTWTTPVPKLPRQVGPCNAHQLPMGCLMLALSMEQWKLYKPSATEQEVHQTCPLLSWSTLTGTLTPPSLTALCPLFLFAAVGPPQKASAHISSCPTSWHGQSLSTSPRVSP